MSKFTKKDIVLLFQMFLALVLMLMPYSVPEKAMYVSGDEVVTVVTDVFAYFSKNSLSYSGFVPFISWFACVAAIILFFTVLPSKKKGNKRNICFFVAIFISLAASAATFFIYHTLLSGIITVILLASCVLFLLCQGTNQLKYGNH